MFKVLKAFTLSLVVALFGLSGQAFASDPIYTGTFSNKALKGYDAVSYFQGDGKPLKGSKEFQTEWRGADWYFVSKENLEAFKTNPEQYAPQYGGYCAWATAHDTLAKGDPLIYTLLDGKLYLNYDKKIDGNWQPRKAELIKEADAKYPDLVDLNQ